MTVTRNDGSPDFGARAYVFSIIVAGAAVAAYSVYDLIRHPVALEWMILVGLTVVSGWATLRIPAMPISFSISDTFNIGAALLFGPAAGAITAALDGLVLSARMESSRRSVDRVLFNMAAVTISLWLAAQVFFAIEGNRPQLDGPLAALRLLASLLLFGAIDFGLNSGIVAVAVSFERRVSILAIWREHLAGVWLAYFGGIFAAMLVILLARFSTLETLILIAPLPVILYVTFRHALGRATDQIDHLAKVNRVYVGAIEALAHAVDAKDEVTHDHTRRVQDRAVQLARALDVERRGRNPGDQGGLAPARRREAGDSRTHSEQARPAHSRRVRHHEAPCADRRRHPVGDRFPLRGRADRAPSPRELGRIRVSGWTGRRRHPDRLAHSRRGRLLRRADVRPAVSPQDGGSRGAARF